jgi:oligopeptidase B
VKFPQPIRSVDLFDNGNVKRKTLKLIYSSPTQPATIFDLDVRSAKIKTWEQVQLPHHEPNDFVTERVSVRSQDGIEIPVTLSYRKGLEMNGKNPVFMVGYGLYGTLLTPGFSFDNWDSTSVGNYLPLLQRGFIVALAHVRGGGELGSAWRDSAILGNKKKSMEDYLDVARYLIANKYTGSRYLTGYGFSAGGMLVGYSATRGSDLFHSLILDGPFVDCLTTMLGSERLTTSHYPLFGNPKTDRDAYFTIKSYSPYENLDARKYPNLLVISNWGDTNVLFSHGTKFVAKTRAHQQGQSNVILKTGKDGHMGSSEDDAVLSDLADRIAFTIDSLDRER